ncbi:MAG TPA: hypothetical protein DIW44_09005 [Anaerolineaceae bacterium]|nr:hypothetical protein [Anaerolineaceae bacterium]
MKAKHLERQPCQGLKPWQGWFFMRVSAFSRFQEHAKEIGSFFKNPQPFKENAAIPNLDKA